MSTQQIAYSYKQAAAATSYGVATIKRAVRSGALKAHRPKVDLDSEASDRSRVVILHDDLMAWLESEVA